MSYTANIGPTPKNQIQKAIDELTPQGSESAASVESLKLAKEAVKIIAEGMNGPDISVHITGHANGTGDKTPQGMSADFISINISQRNTQPE